MSSRIEHRRKYHAIAKKTRTRWTVETPKKFFGLTVHELAEKYREDPNLNNIPLARWDSLANSWRVYNRDARLSLAEAVCLQKFCAVQLLESLEDWKYLGDVDLGYGGSFVKVDSDFHYADIVRVTDLSSATGADGLVLIERKTVHDLTSKEEIARSLDCYGLSFEDLRGLGKKTVLETIALAMDSYGYSDPTYNYRDPDSYVVVYNYGPFCSKDNWDSWWSHYGDKSETLKIYHQYNGSLEDYITNEVLD